MNVLYFHQHFGTLQGATGTRSYELSKALIAAGHRVTMVCGEYHHGALNLPFDEKYGWSRGDVDGIDVISLPLVYTNRDGLTKRSLTFFRFALKSVQVALNYDYDLVFATSTPLTTSLPGIAGRLLRGKPFVFEVRDLWPELPRALGMRNPFLLGIMSFIEWASYRAARGCIGLSPGIVEGILRRSQPEKPVEMVPNGCDLDLFKPREREELSLPGVGAEDFVAAFTGAHGLANGLVAVLEAAAVLKMRGNKKIKIVFIGDGKEKTHLVASAQSQGLENCLFFPSMPKRDLAVLTGSLNCGLMILKNVPAFYYGTSPNKFFDYISAGIPVLNNYPGWLADLIREHNCGMAVTPDNPEAFADALEYLATHPDESRHMGQNARKLAKSQFGRQQLAAQFVSFLEEHRH
jgi:glycosyltransferase involved in cell wall biosynthesis